MKLRTIIYLKPSMFMVLVSTCLASIAFGFPTLVSHDKRPKPKTNKVAKKLKTDSLSGVRKNKATKLKKSSARLAGNKPSMRIKFEEPLPWLKPKDTYKLASTESPAKSSTSSIGSIGSTGSTGVVKSKLPDSVKPKTPDISFGGSADLMTGTNLVSGNGQVASTDLNLTPILNVYEWALMADATFSQEMTKTQKATVSNTRVSLYGPGLDWSKDIHSYFGVFGVAPTKKADVDRDSYKGSMGLSNIDVLNFGRVGLVYQLDFSRLYHDYKINREGTPNARYKLANRLDANIKVWRGFGIGLTGKYRSGWSYNNSYLEYYYLSEDITYAFTENLTAYTGHEIEGDPGSEFKAFDPFISKVHIGLRFSM